MKKIYRFTLDDDVPLSMSVDSDIREVAFWLYDELSHFDDQIVCVDNYDEPSADGLIRNDLYDLKVNNEYVYHFTSDFVDVKNKMMYEPFILDDRSFGFTVNDGKMSDEEIERIFDGILKLLKINYKFNIESITYDDSNKKNRLIAIKNLLTKKTESEVKTKKRVKPSLKTITTMLFIH